MNFEAKISIDIHIQEWPRMDHSGSWELTYSHHWAKYMNLFRRFDEYNFAEFLRLFDTSFKNAKVMFFEIWKT